MKNRICLLLTILFIFMTFTALADTEAYLADSGYAITLPDKFEYQAPGNEDYDADLTAIYLSDDTEIEIFSYPVGEITWRELLSEMKKAASDAGMTNVNGIETLWFVTSDPADGATCVGYMLPAKNALVEVDFWVGTQKAMDATEAIFESLHRIGGSDTGAALSVGKTGGNA